MHRTLKRDTTRPAAKNLLQQQERFDRFIEEFNQIRPHEALDQKPPAQVYKSSSRLYPEKPAEPEYPLHDDVLLVSKTGSITLCRKHYFISTALGGQPIGLREEEAGHWSIAFMNLELGYIDPKQGKFLCNVPERQA